VDVAVTLQEICVAHDRAMAIHDLEQHNSHVWRWLVEMLRLWGLAHPIRVQG
jgi:hypothetical protein